MADSTRDALVYKDGDRIFGQLVQQTPDLIVFKSARFGLLRVAAKDAVVIKAQKPTEQPVKEVVAAGIEKPAATAAKEAERVSIWNRFSPAVLTAKVREFFGPWTGRIAFSNEFMTDTAHHDNLALESHLARKFTRDALDFGARYDYDQVNGAPITDIFKASGSWRHDFTLKEFGQYRPTVEWNRDSIKNGALNKYVLTQQEIGYGLNLYTTPAYKVRVGVSENLFDVWNSAPTAGHTSRAVGSLFDETELALPWRMTLTQRGVWYPEAHHADSWEDQIELNKKLTETLSVALRHEIRRNSPDGTALDYTRLKLLLQLDF